MKKSNEITLSDIKFGEKVLINGHVYEYAGQEKVNFKGMKKSQYIFKGITTDFQKPFDVSANLRIRKVIGRQDEVKFEIY